jgi:D-sedoheptulose 7-phosphate isomerase
MHTIGLTGHSIQLMTDCDYTISSTSNSTPIIQETHLAIEHMICSIIESTLFSKSK